MKYIMQDVTKVRRGVIAHGVNCQSVMGSGVAKAIRNEWPEVYQTYMQKGANNAFLGTCDIINVGIENTLFVANCYTQLYYGRSGKYANASAIFTSLFGAVQHALLYDLPLYMPKIGAGLGGLDWETEVLPQVREIDDWYTTEIYVCDI